MPITRELIDRLRTSDPELKELELYHSTIRDIGLNAIVDALSSNNKLKTLILTGLFNDAEVSGIAEALQTNRSITKLVFQHIYIGITMGQAIAALLSTNDVIEEFRLRSVLGGGVSFIGEALSSNRGLKRLYVEVERQISDNRDTVKALGKGLESNRTLRELELMGVIGNEGATAIAGALSNNSSLKSLRLESHQIGTAGVSALAAALTKNETLEELVLGSVHQIGIEEGEAIAEALASNHGLRMLDLSGNYINPAGVIAIGEGLKTNVTLKKLSLGILPDESVQAIASALRSNNTLKVLTIYCSCDMSGIAAAALLANDTLEELNLNGYGIRNDWVKVFASALSTNATLKQLYLSHCGIADEGAMAIAAALRTNNTLKRLSLDGNNITDRAAEVIVASLSNNAALKELDLGIYCGISNEAAGGVAATLITNTTLRMLSCKLNYFRFRVDRSVYDRVHHWLGLGSGMRAVNPIQNLIKRNQHLSEIEKKLATHLEAKDYSSISPNEEAFLSVYNELMALTNELLASNPDTQFSADLRETLHLADTMCDISLAEELFVMAPAGEEKTTYYRFALWLLRHVVGAPEWQAVIATIINHLRGQATDLGEANFVEALGAELLMTYETLRQIGQALLVRYRRDNDIFLFNSHRHRMAYLENLLAFERYTPHAANALLTYLAKAGEIKQSTALLENVLHTPTDIFVQETLSQQIMSEDQVKQALAEWKAKSSSEKAMSVIEKIVEEDKSAIEKHLNPPEKQASDPVRFFGRASDLPVSQTSRDMAKLLSRLW